MADSPHQLSPRDVNKVRKVEIIEAGTFEPTEHFYPRVLNAQIHPLVRSFLSLGNDRISKRYCHLHPEAKPEAVSKVLSHSTRYFQWGGADLFSSTSDRGMKRLVVVETNSCPSGQKSMPLANEDMEHAGYRTLLERAFMPALLSGQFNGHRLPEGKLAVFYDKNKMEASGYGATLADLAGEAVYLVPCFPDDLDPKVRCREDGVLEICTSDAVLWNQINHGNGNAASNGDSENGQTYGALTTSWEPVRAALRYVTQRPWTRFPPITRTMIFNPVLACLAGGRNKVLAAKAYDLFNAEIAESGLTIRTPETIWDVTKPEVPLWVRRMGGLAVVKVPYANAGQGVWTITHEGELQEFMSIEHRYDRFIVQALIGNKSWSSLSHHGRLYHVGTIPNLKGSIYAADLRLMVGSSPSTGFFPVAIYARRARLPLAEKLDAGTQSWDMLGTNLSVKNEDGSWGTETERLLLMDSKDFNKIGIGVDDLIEAYMQTALAVSAIDNLACKLITPKGKFGLKLFQSINPDPKLLAELYLPQLKSPSMDLQDPKAGTFGSRLNRRQNSDVLEERMAEELKLQIVSTKSPPSLST